MTYRWGYKPLTNLDPIWHRMERPAQGAKLVRSKCGKVFPASIVEWEEPRQIGPNPNWDRICPTCDPWHKRRTKR